MIFKQNKRKVTLRKPFQKGGGNVGGTLVPLSNKKGSHVGLVLSFVIFVVFLIFMYPLVGPALETKGDKQYLLEPLEKKTSRPI